MGKRLNNDVFIEISNKVHNNKYDYSLVDYKNNKTKVKIICPIHGVFEQRPDGHLKGIGCSKCQFDKRAFDTMSFIEKSNKVHNNKYDYSLVNYVNARTKVKIICPTHGIFEQNLTTHVLQKHGCYKCAGQNIDSTELIKKFNEVHNNKYDYSLVEYKKSHIKVKIICPKHGVFEQTPNNHIRGRGCPQCKVNYGEQKIKEFLDENNIKYVRHHSFDDCRNKNPLWFDFYLVDSNTCIEYDGIQHFESVNYFGGETTFASIKKNDKIKDRYCEKKGINLIRFKYNEELNFSLINK